MRQWCLTLLKKQHTEFSSQKDVTLSEASVLNKYFQKTWLGHLQWIYTCTYRFLVKSILFIYRSTYLCWERLRAGGEGSDTEWDGWMASLNQRTWVWASSGSAKDREAWRTSVHGVTESDMTYLMNNLPIFLSATYLPIFPSIICVFYLSIRRFHFSFYSNIFEAYAIICIIRTLGEF